jgi:hypothetical protein
MYKCRGGLERFFEREEAEGTERRGGKRSTSNAQHPKMEKIPPKGDK